jgi:predicted alpha-1,2-mannosidase
MKKLTGFVCSLLLVTMVKAGPGNIAPKAKVTVSTIQSAAFKGENLVDGIIGVDGIGEWACEGDTTDWGYIRLPWAQLTWDQPQLVNKIVLYDRPSLRHNIAGCKILFSDGSVVWVNQIPADGTGKAITFPAKKTNWIKIVVHDATGRELGFSEIEVYPSPEQANDYISWVDPYIETNRGRDIFFITGSTPFGLVSAAPLTRNKNQYGGSYNYNETEILGFEQIHAWMVAGLEIMPTTDKVNLAYGQHSWKSKFNHDDEIVQPAYHRVMLQDQKIWVENTVTERTSLYRFRYTQASQGKVVINLGGYVTNSTMADAKVHRVSDTEIEGSFSTIKRYWGGPRDVKIFFVIRFDKPFRSLDAWKGGQQLRNQTSYAGDSLILSADYPMQKGEQLQMKIGLSYTTIANARNNMDTECPGWDFDKVRQQAQQTWNEWLGRMDVKGGTRDQRVKFYTDLWHVLLGRQKISDINGDYPDRTEGKREGTFTDAVFKIKTVPKDQQGKPRFQMYSSDAFWLTQWNLNILWGLAWPEVQDEMSASLIEYANNGGLLPRGPCGGGYSYIMTGNPAASLIVSTYMKGLLTKADARHAYNTIKRNQMPGGMLGPKADVEFYISKGWWPDNAGISIEAAFQDWGTAQMAAKLGLKKDYRYFAKRAGGWHHLFDEDNKLIFPKDRQGKWLHKDPLSGAGWVEANAWQATTGLSHALPELIQRMGGPDSFTNKIDYAFRQSQADDFVYGYTSGYVSYANQPGCSNAHVFSYAGKPWLTQYWVRRVKEQAYGGVTPDLGYGGHDEDQGQMGGVSALMAIGLFDVMGNESQQPVYEITSPIFDEITIKLDKRYYTGDQFVIRTINNSAANIYIQQAKLNGENWNRFWFPHETFKKGGVLEIWLGATPNKNWGVGELPPVFTGNK